MFIGISWANEQSNQQTLNICSITKYISVDSLPLIQEEHLTVSGKRMFTILVNRFEERACPVKVWLGKLTVFVCVEVLRPSQPNGVMSSAVSLPNHTFTGQA